MKPFPEINVPETSPRQSLDEPAAAGDDRPAEIDPSEESEICCSRAQLFFVLGSVHHQGNGFVQVDSPVVRCESTKCGFGVGDAILSDEPPR